MEEVPEVEQQRVLGWLALGEARELVRCHLQIGAADVEVKIGTSLFGPRQHPDVRIPHGINVEQILVSPCWVQWTRVG